MCDLLHMILQKRVVSALGEVRMHRRTVLKLAGAASMLLATPLAAGAQQPAKVTRIGYLAGALTANPHLAEAFRQGLRERGYVENRNVRIEYRSAEGQLERLSDLAVELVRLKVDVLMTEGTPPTLAAKQATQTIPIVFAGAADAVAGGLVASLARPGGNVTGLTFLGPDIVGKHLQLLKQTLPKFARVAVLWQSAGPGALPERAQKALLNETETAARALAVQLHPVEVRGSGDFERAFSEIAAARVDAVTVLTSFMMFVERKRIDSHVNTDLMRRAAGHVDRIVKGAKPGDLPVEQPTTFELVFNLRSAKAINLTIPASLLQRADRVVE
ncbi:MAG: ABC transporter substrate-binding protein [Betaproteobacteria bacterium]